MAGLYFANAQEAQHFNETVQGKLENRRKKPQCNFHSFCSLDYELIIYLHCILAKKTNHAPINIQPNDQGITIQSLFFTISNDGIVKTNFIFIQKCHLKIIC